jgi:DNA-binding MarR family transcriptional regulator
MPRTSAGDALLEVMWEVLQLFFALRTRGKRIGAVTQWGGGNWGLMRLIKERGPQTVPQIARLRGYTRQRIQKLADEMSEGGVIEFFDNPAHRSSWLMRLTPKGEAVYARITARIGAEAALLAADMDPIELDAALRVLRRFRAKLGPT